FQSSSPTPYLHSFPTRRSSDLLRKMRFGNAFRLEKETDGTLKAFEYKIDDESVLKVQRGSDSYEAKVEKLDLEIREKTMTAEIQDRKSTRLNSSHDQISYAVFC